MTVGDLQHHKEEPRTDEIQSHHYYSHHTEQHVAAPHPKIHRDVHITPLTEEDDDYLMSHFTKSANLHGLVDEYDVDESGHVHRVDADSHFL